MTFKIALAQCWNTSFIDIDPAGPEYVESIIEVSANFYKRSALEQIEEYTIRAKCVQADLVVFPEYMMCPPDLS